MNNYFETSEIYDSFSTDDSTQQYFDLETGYEPEHLLSETVFDEFEVNTEAPQILDAYMQDKLAFG